MPEPATLALTIGKYILGLFLGARQARNARRQQQAVQRANSTIELNQSGAGQTLQSVYGYMSISMQSVYSRPNNSFTRPTDGLISDLNNRNWHGTLQTGSSGGPQYALFQYPVSIGEMQSFLDIIIQGEPNQETFFTHLLFGETGDYATAFRPDNNDATFTELSYLNAVFQQRLSDPQYTGAEVPVRVVVQGRKVPILNSSDNGVTVTVAENKAYRNDMASVLLDYLTSQEVGVGPGMNINEDIDLPSFYKAIQQCRVVVQNDFFSRQFAGQPNFTSHLLRHEFNGSIPSDHDFPNAITRIISVVPGALLFRSHLTGKYKLVLPDESNETNKTYTTSNGGIIGRVEVTQPGADDSLTRIQGTFTNARKEFTQDTAIYPEAGSQLATDLINRQRGRRTSTSVDLHGVNNFTQAYSVLHSMLRLSSRIRYTATLSPEGFWHEPGDIITIQDDLIGPDLIRVYILDTEIDQNFNNTIEGYAWVAGDVAYQSSPTETIPPPRVIDRNWPAPTITEPLSLNETYRDIDIVVEPADNQSPLVSAYEYEYQIDGTWEGWRTSSSTRVRFTVPRRGGTFRFRVRARGVSRHSPWSPETAAITVAPGELSQSAPGIERIYAKQIIGQTPTLPDNSWGYRTRPAPGTALNNWYSSAPNLSSGEVLFSSERDLIGAPAVGSQIDNDWTAPVSIGAFGADGEDGETGQTGERGEQGPPGAAISGSDGIGREWIFIAWNSDNNPPSVPPASTLYDTPTNGWTDGEPQTDSVNRYIWWTSRMVTGDPQTGDVINTPFNSPPRLLPQGQDGRDGNDGNPGSDGFGIEECFALVGMNRNSFSASERPSNSWNFGVWPGNGYLRNTILWRCDRPPPTVNHPKIFRSWRRIPASLATGNPIPNSGLSQPRSFYNWSTPELIHEGAPGEGGAGSGYAMRQSTNLQNFPNTQNNSFNFDILLTVDGGGLSTPVTATFRRRFVWTGSGIGTQRTFNVTYSIVNQSGGGTFQFTPALTTPQVFTTEFFRQVFVSYIAAGGTDIVASLLLGYSFAPPPEPPGFNP